MFIFMFEGRLGYILVKTCSNKIGQTLSLFKVAYTVFNLWRLRVGYFLCELREAFFSSLFTDHSSFSIELWWSKLKQLWLEILKYYITLVRQYVSCRLGYVLRYLYQLQRWRELPPRMQTFAPWGRLEGAGNTCTAHSCGKNTLWLSVPAGGSSGNSFGAYCWDLYVTLCHRSRQTGMSVLLCCPTEKATRDHGFIIVFLTNKPFCFNEQ